MLSAIRYSLYPWFDIVQVAYVRNILCTQSVVTDVRKPLSSALQIGAGHCCCCSATKRDTLTTAFKWKSISATGLNLERTWKHAQSHNNVTCLQGVHLAVQDNESLSKPSQAVNTHLDVCPVVNVWSTTYAVCYNLNPQYSGTVPLTGHT